MITKKKLLEKVVQDYPGITPRSCMESFKSVVSHILRLELGLESEILENSEFNSFVNTYCHRVSTLSKKKGGLKHLLKHCNKYLVFFSTKVTIALVLRLSPYHSKKMTNEQKNIRQNLKKDPLIINEELLFSYKFLFESTTDDRKFNSLDELTEYGKNFLVCCLHILFESDLVQDYEKAIHTWNWIKSNGKLNISMQTVFGIIRNWMYNPEHEKESVNVNVA
jgi:hypothetical protein